MKTNQKLLLGIGLVVAACIGFVIGVVVDYPAPVKSELAGTIGKASKYHKSQMTEKDIKLRSEIVRDSAQLRSTVQGLVYFSLFSKDLVNDIDMSVMLFKNQGMKSNPGEGDPLQALKDYSDFIRNNTETLNATVTMLTGFYLNDSVNQSFDVERNLREFGLYVDKLNEKSNILSQALAGMDEYLLANESLKENINELVRLKSIRDQLLIQGVKLGGLTGNRQQVGALLEYALGAQEKLNLYCSQETIAAANGIMATGDQKQFIAASNDGLNGRIMSQDELKRILSQEDLKIRATTEIGMSQVLAGQAYSGSHLLMYDRSTLGFIVLSKEDLNTVILMGNSSLEFTRMARDLDLIAMDAMGNLNVVLQSYSIQAVAASGMFGGYLQARPLHAILFSNQLNIVVGAYSGLNNHEL